MWIMCIFARNSYQKCVNHHISDIKNVIYHVRKRYYQAIGSMENGREQETARYSWGSSSRKDMGFEIFREGIFRGCRLF